MSESIITIAALTATERKQLAKYETAIKMNLRGFREVGEALADIRDRRLYRETHATFEAYLEGRWEISRRHGYRLIEAAEAAADVSHGTHDLPPVTNERQARELAAAPPEDRPEVWRESVNRSGGEAPAARVIAEVVAERSATKPDGSPDPFGGEQAAAASFMQNFRDRKAAREGTPTLAKSTAVPAATEERPVRDGDEWYSPATMIALVREVMPTIDLDPFSCDLANQTVGADNFYTESINGLEQPWWGHVFMNPPYSNAGECVERLVQFYLAGAVTEAIALVNAKTETAWFGLLWQHATICFVSGRISFVPGDGGASQTGRTGSAVAYLGPDPEKFRDVFARVGIIARRWDAPTVIRLDQTA